MMAQVLGAVPFMGMEEPNDPDIRVIRDVEAANVNSASVSNDEDTGQSEKCQQR